MKRIIYVGIAVLLASVSASAEEFSEVEYYRQLQQAENAAPETAVIVKQPYETWTEAACAPEPPKNVLVIMPQYHHSRNDQANFKVGGDNLQMSKGHANGVSTTVIYNRRFTDLLSVAFMYEYAFMNVTGGMPMGRGADEGGFEDARWHSNVFGILPEFNFGKFGRLQVSYIAGFDRASGHERVVATNGAVERRSIDSSGTNVTSLMAWYEKDFDLGCSNWKLTPYAGWRSLYVVVKDANVWPAGADVRSDSNLWAHLVSGGMKLSYQNGPLGFSLRGGINHRTTRDDLPGYASRAVAPGVVHFSHRANMDRTIGSVGAAVSYAINERAIVGVGYDGTFGKDTSAHTATLSLICPF
ncbi:MAG: autotransporter outer membrane beta-barrel domain-containing protein [Planctomycetes bacterium]|nr:autotransporter outer membrane beta-barrel domain-containing protein [Planctomycetota bacterium]